MFFGLIKKLNYAWVILTIIVIFCEVVFLWMTSPVLKFNISRDRDVWLDTILYSRVGVTLINLCWVVILLLFILFGFGVLNWTRILIQLKFILTVWITTATGLLSCITVEVYRNLYHSTPNDLIFKSPLLEITRIWRPDELLAIACSYVQTKGFNIPVFLINKTISGCSTLESVYSELDSLIAKTHTLLAAQQASSSSISPYVTVLVGVLGILAIGLFTYFGYRWFSGSTVIPPEFGNMADNISPEIFTIISIQSLRIACYNLDSRLTVVEEDLRNLNTILFELFGPLPIADNTKQLEALSAALAKFTSQVIGLEVPSETSRKLVAATLAMVQQDRYRLNSIVRVVLSNNSSSEGVSNDDVV